MGFRVLAMLAVFWLTLPARELSPVWFARAPDGVWRSRGADVSVEVGNGGLVVDGFAVRFRNGRLRTVVPEASGILRRVSPAGVDSTPIASALLLPDIWPGIDARLSFREGRFKLDWLLAPGASLPDIQFRVAGLQPEVLDTGDLRIENTFRLLRPVALQAGREVSTAWHVARQGWIGFRAGPYDPALPLEIDPYMVAWAGNFGGTGLDVVRAMTVDSAGSVYLAGYTDSTSMFPSPRRASRGGTDAFVLKYVPGTSQVAWATYLGGSAYDSAAALTLDASGNVWVTGSTTSSDFPQTNPRVAKGDHDIFAARLDTTGALAVSTLLGGSLADKANAIAMSPWGEVWIAGETKSPDFPLVTPKAGFSGVQDAFLIRFAPDGTLLYSTLWGGAGADSARAIALDSNYEVLIAGTTASANFPVINPAQLTRSGVNDAFVVRFSPDALAVRFSTFLGGPETDASFPESANAMAVDAAGNTWVAGTTASKAFPALTPIQPVAGGGTTDAFIARYDRSGALTFSSVYGGNGSDEANALALAGDGNVLIAGTTSSTDLALIDGISVFGGLSDGFVLRLAPSPPAILWATYLGLAGTDSIEALTSFGSTVYLAGTTDTRFLATSSIAGRTDTWAAGITLSTSYGVSIVPSVSGAGYQVAGSGCDPGSWTGTRTFGWTPGVVCTVTPAPSTVSGGTRWRATTGAQTFQALPSRTSISLAYATDYLLSRSVSPPGAGTVFATPGSPDDWYAAGTTLQLNAAAAPGYAYAGWSGIPANGVAVMNGPTTATANFTCTYSLSSTATPVGEPGGPLGIDVSTGASCAWSATSNASWITLTTPATRTGSGSVGVAVAANTGGARDGTVTVAGQTWTVRQNACMYSLSAATASFGDAGGTFDMGVSTGAACPWTITPGASWIGVSGTSSRSGSASVTVSVAGNMTGAARTSSVNVAGQTLTVQQAGCSYALSPGSSGVGEAGGTAMIAVTTGSTCTWSAISNSPWISVTGTATRTGSGSVAAQIDGNTSGATRTGSVTVGGQTWTVSQGGCSYTLSSQSSSLNDSAGTASISVSAGPTCAWTASSNSPWLTLTSPANQTGPGLVSANLTANSTGTTRTGTVTVAGQSWTIQQSACAFTLSSSSTAVADSGGTASIDVVTGSACAWAAASNAQWITLTTPASRTGSGSVGVSLSANSSGSSRIGTVSVAGQSWTIQQSACAFTLSSSSTAVADSGGTASIDVTTGSACAWSAASNAQWITLTTPASRTGPGSVGVSLSANSSGSSRIGTVSVAGQSWTIQQGACAFTLSSSSTAVADSGGTASIDVTTGSACAWSAASNAQWIALTTSASRTGSGSVGVSLSANSSGSARTGTVTVAGQSWTIQQSACAFTLNSTGSTLSDAGGTASISVSTGSACPWTAASNAQWITLTTPASRTGPGTASVSVSANPGSGRTGTVTVAGQTWTVSQSTSTCTVSADLTKVGTVPVSGQAYTIPLTVTGPNCSSWSLTPNAPWIELNPVAGNAATKQVVVTAYPNFGTQTRTGTFTAGAQTFSISQVGSSLPETTRFIQLAYFGSLGRMPTAGEITDWSNQISAGKTRTDVVTFLFNSEEFNTTSRFIAGLYVGLLNRDPEYGGWRYQRTNLNAGVVNQTNIVGTFINSPEYGIRWGNPTPAEFVRLLYRYILLREGTDAEVAWQVGNLGPATTNEKIGMARNFLNSQEFRIGAGPRLTAFLLFAAVLARDGVPEERSFMADAIKASVPVSVMITSFIGSAEMAEILK